MAEFRTLPIDLSFHSAPPVKHYIYFKEHFSKDPRNVETPQGRTLFLVNLPLYCSAEYLKKIFSVCGDVDRVSLGLHTEENKSLRQIDPLNSLLFPKRKSLQAALSMEPFRSLQDSLEFLSQDMQPLRGMKKWMQDYQQVRGERATLQNEVDEFLRDFDQRVADEAKERQKTWNEPDADGFITVGKGGRKHTDGTVTVAGTPLSVAEKRKKKQEMLLDFYRYQQRQGKREHIAHLRRKFEEDKQRIAHMKANRKFKPF